MGQLISLETTLSNPRTWLGYQRMMDAIVKGELLHDVLMGLIRFQPKGETPNYDMFNGALQCLLDAWSSMVSAGVTVTSEDKKSLENFLNGSKARMLCDLMQADAASNTDSFALLIYSLCD
ncbi:MAG: hypothetical protein WCI85_14030, partial [Comamonadaceae bacterium]